MTRKELVALAIRAATSYQTTMAKAFRRALGIELDPPGVQTGRWAGQRERETYRGVRECFENREHVREDACR